MDFVWDVMERLLRDELASASPPPSDYLEACGVIKPLPPPVTDGEVAKQFLWAVHTALESGTHCLLPKYKQVRGNENSILLGLYDDTTVMLISAEAYRIYQQTTNSTIHIRNLISKLVAVGLAVPPKSTYGKKRMFKNKRHNAILIQRQAANTVSGYAFNALQSAK